MADAPLPPDFANGVKEPASAIRPDDSASQHSETAHDFITSQLQLEADAREALPYAFDHCTQPLGALKQNLFSCLTCNPPDSSTFQPAAVCYSCSIACHGEHTLVELFNRRNFTCDCGTTRIPTTSPCTLRIDPATGMKGPVHSEPAAEGNTYNQNCRNRFCGCGEVYDAHQEKGTMFQCLGLAQEKDGGCGEDWWHPECVTGIGREWAKKEGSKPKEEASGHDAGEDVDAEDHPIPPGFPQEDDFDTFICYKCIDAHPWIKPYAGTTGFLPAVVHHQESQPQNRHTGTISSSPDPPNAEPASAAAPAHPANPSPVSPPSPKKRSAADAELDTPPSDPKRPKSTDPPSNAPTTPPPPPNPAYHASLPPPPPPGTQISLFLHPTFRDHLCRCQTCYPRLAPHPHLLEEESSYEPPLSESSSGPASAGGGSQRSLLERGEAALSNVDRVRAIEGVMVYNQLKDKVKAFLQPFAESGQAVGAEDIKAYFEKLRGDEQGIQAAAAAGDANAAAGAGAGGGGSGGGSGGGEGEGGGGGERKGEGDHRREQDGELLPHPYSSISRLGMEQVDASTFAQATSEHASCTKPEGKTGQTRAGDWAKSAAGIRSTGRENPTNHNHTHTHTQRSVLIIIIKKPLPAQFKWYHNVSRRPPKPPCQ